MVSPIINIDVGGKVFRSTVASLSRAPLLDAILRHHHDSTFADQLTREGNLFIDRSPELFLHVLEVLRSDGDTDISASSPAEAARLVQEFKYYGLEAESFGQAEATLSAQYLSGKLYLHVSATASVISELDEALDPQNIRLEKKHLNQCIFRKMQALPSNIPEYIAHLGDAFACIGFEMDRRSENSSVSFAPRHWIEHLAKEYDDEMGLFEYEGGYSREAGDDLDAAYGNANAKVLWISQTVTYRRGLTIRVKSPPAYFSDGLTAASKQIPSDMKHDVQPFTSCPAAPHQGASTPGIADESHTVTVNLGISSGSTYAAALPVLNHIVHDEPAAAIHEEEASRTAEELWASGVERLASSMSSAGSGVNGIGASAMPAASDFQCSLLLLQVSRHPPELLASLSDSAELAHVRNALTAKGLSWQLPGQASVLVDPDQYKIAVDAAMDVTGRELRPYHIITSEHYEAIVMEVISSIRSRLNVRTRTRETIFTPHEPEVARTFLHVPERVLRNADSVTQSTSEAVHGVQNPRR